MEEGAAVLRRKSFQAMHRSVFCVEVVGCEELGREEEEARCRRGYSIRKEIATKAEGEEDGSESGRFWGRKLSKTRRKPVRATARQRQDSKTARQRQEIPTRFS